jgi:hypothetical protein
MEDINISPEVWKPFAMLLGGTLIWIIQRYIGYLNKILDKLTDSVNELTSMAKIHEQRLDNHEGELSVLKDKYIVKYRK